MVKWRLGVVAVLLLSGCASPLPGDGAPEGTPNDFGFLDPVVLPQPTDGGEPTLAVMADGTLFITAKAGNQDKPSLYEGASWLWRSRDGGASWSTLREPIREVPTTPVTREPVRASDPDVLVSNDGWVYYLDWWITRAPLVVPPGLPVGLPGPTNFVVERSQDGGETWEKTPTTIPADEGLGVDRPWLVSGKAGFVGIAYNGMGDVISGGSPGLRFVTSTDHGATWGTPITAVPEKAGEFLLIGRPFALGETRIVMPYGRVVDAGDDYPFNDPAEVHVAWSDDQGATWKTTMLATEPEGFDQIWPVQGTSSPDGNAFVAWSAVNGTSRVLSYAQSGDGATWNTPQRLTSSGASMLPWIAAQSAQRFAVGYFNSTHEGDPRNATSETEWFAAATETLDGGTTWAAAVASDGAVKLGRLCPIGTFCERDRVSDRELLDYVGLIYGPDGALHFSWTESREQGGAKIGQVVYARSRT